MDEQALAPTKTNRAPKRRPGRPSKLTEQTKVRILNAIRCGAPNKVACAAAGIGERTFYVWEEKGRERPNSEYAQFLHALTKARQEGITARLALIQKAAVKDWRAAAWLLERDMPDVFSMRYRVEHTGCSEMTLVEAFTRCRVDYKPDPVKEVESW